MRRLHVNLGPDFRVDVAALIGTGTLLCGNSGAGKSHAVRLLLEKIGGRVPFHLLDREGEFHTLRPVVDAILVAVGGDLEPRAATARALAAKLLELRMSVILDLSGLRTSERLRFATEYLEGLLGAPQSSWHQCLVVVDEAHFFAPQTVDAGDKEISSAISACRRAVITLMDAGRKRGLGGVLASQRLAKVATSARAEANNLIIGRFSGDVDVRRAISQLGLERSAAAQIQAFRPGEFFVQGPAFEKPGTTRVRTFPKTETHQPRPGELLPAAKPSPQIARVLQALSSIPEAQAEDAPAPARGASASGDSAELRRLRAEVERLRADLEARPAPPTAEQLLAAQKRGADTARAEVEAAIEGLLARLRAQGTRAEPTPQSKRSAEHMSSMLGLQAGSSASPRRSAPPRRVPRPQPQGNGALPFGWDSTQGRILAVLLHERDGARKSPQYVASRAQVHPRKSTMRNAVSDLRKHGLVEGGLSQGMTASPYAVEHFRALAPALPSGDRLIQALRGRFSGIALRMYDEIVSAGGQIHRDELARAVDTDPEKSTMRNALSDLRREGVIQKRSGEKICLEKYVLAALESST